MPAALDVDKEQVQMLVLTYGAREAARQLGLSENTVLAWSARGEWLKDSPGPAFPKVQSVAIVSPVECFKNALNERGNRSRLAVAKGLGAAADEIAEMPGATVIANAQDIKAVVTSLSTVHAWQDQAAMVKMNLSITSQPQTMEAQITELPNAEELP